MTEWLLAPAELLESSTGQCPCVFLCVCVCVCVCTCMCACVWLREGKMGSCCPVSNTHVPLNRVLCHRQAWLAGNVHVSREQRDALTHSTRVLDPPPSGPPGARRDPNPKSSWVQSQKMTLLMREGASFRYSC